MRKRLFAVATWLLCALFAGCGRGEGAAEVPAEGEVRTYCDIMTEREYFPGREELKGELNADGGYHDLRFLGMQFVEGEPVQIWSDRSGGSPVVVYLCGTDGALRPVLEGVSDEYTYGFDKWYLDSEGSFYCCVPHLEDHEAELVKLDAEGEELYRVVNGEAFPYGVQGVRELEDGRVYLLLDDDNSIGMKLGELDPSSGEVAVLKEVELDPVRQFGSGQYLGEGEGDVALCTYCGIRELNGDGELEELLGFSGTSYTTSDGRMGVESQCVRDFRATGDGGFEVLWSLEWGVESYVERLRLEEVRRIPVTVCGTVVSDWVKRQAARFNRENDTYYVVVEEYGAPDRVGREEYDAAVEDFVTLVGVRTAAGKGPDVFVGADVLGGDVSGMAERGVLEDLGPYMEGSGIREEDYFPMVFDCWRDGEGIYGVLAEVEPYVYEVEERVLPEGREAGVDSLTDGLSSYGERAVYMEDVGPGELLRHFLEGSEDLWGMVDWEAGTCGFGTELFGELLETARTYGDDLRGSHRILARKAFCGDFYGTENHKEMKERGRVLSGGLFDDGVHAVAEGSPVAINAASSHKEAAWEFLLCLLGEEAQTNLFFCPVRRDTYERWTKKQLTRISGIMSVVQGFNGVTDGERTFVKRYYDKEDLDFIKKEKLPYFTDLLEGARCLPIRPVPLVDIVCQEAEDYFNGSKSLEEVVDIIENRVGLYLNEHR